MIKKPVTAQDAAIKKILDNPANEIQGAVSYTNPQNNTMYKYTPTVNTSVQDAAIQKILQNPKNEINGGVSYEKGNTRYSYTPSYTPKGPQSPSYTQYNSNNNPYAGRPDITQELINAYELGDYGSVAGLEKDLLGKVAYLGGNYEGGSVTDFIKGLRQKYGEQGYNKWLKNQSEIQNIQKLLGDVSSPYDSLYQSLLQKYQDYTFDKFKNSSAYQSMKDLYEMNGKNAMKDVLGEIAARTGGYASSYATAAAQEQYQSYMAQLAALAEQRYGNERNNMLSEVNQMGNRLDSDISRRQATNMNLYNALRQLTLDQKAEEDAEAQREATAQQYARDSIINALSNGVDIDLLDQGLLEQSGLSYMDILAYEKIYSDKSAQQQFENSIKQGNLDINRAKADASIWKTYNTGGGDKSPKKVDDTPVIDKGATVTNEDILAAMDDMYYNEGKTVDEMLAAIDKMFEDKVISNRDKETLRREVVSRYI